MKIFRLLVGVLILLVSLAAQEWLAFFHIAVNLVLATLIASSFYFDILETVLLALVGIFLMNWQPAPSIELGLFIVLPLGAWTLHRVVRWQPWTGAILTIGTGIVLFYLALAPRFFVGNLPLILTDLCASLLAGSFAFSLFTRTAH